jgi:predicted amidohydrolase YtcJ
VSRTTRVQDYTHPGSGPILRRPRPDADLILDHGTVVTLDRASRVAEALARWDSGAQGRLGESRLTREEALRLSVQTGHLLTWSEDRRGSIEVGKDAVLAVLDGNPLTCAEDRIKDVAVDVTIVGGRIVHERGQVAGAGAR